MERWQKEHSEIPNIRMVVIYTGDVEKADAMFRMECMTLRMEQVFVRNLPIEEICRTVIHKLEQGEALTDQELMQMIILPLAEKGFADKRKRIAQIIELAEKIENEQEQKLVLSGLLVASDKFIDKESMEEIRRRFSMTKIGRSIYEDAKKEGWEGGIKEEKKKTAEKLLRKGNSVEIVVDITELSKQEVKEIQEKMLVLK